MSTEVSKLSALVFTHDIELARPAIDKVVVIRNEELKVNGYTEYYYDLDALVEDFNNIYTEDIF